MNLALLVSLAVAVSSAVTPVERAPTERKRVSKWCSNLQFTCDNGRCVQKSLVNNGIDECGDHSDERGQQYFLKGVNKLCKGNEIIDDEKRCKESVDSEDLKNLNLVFQKTESEANWPKGCYVAGKGTRDVYFNTHRYGAKDNTASPICQIGCTDELPKDYGTATYGGCLATWTCVDWAKRGFCQVNLSDDRHCFPQSNGQIKDHCRKSCYNCVKHRDVCCGLLKKYPDMVPHRTWGSMRPKKDQRKWAENRCDDVVGGSSKANCPV